MLTAISVCAVWILGCLDNSLSAALTKEFVPDAPLIFVDSMSTSSSSITVKWLPVSGAMGYRVYRSTSSSGNYVLVGNGTSSTSYTDSNLLYGTTYYYKVSACNGSGEGSQSNYCDASTILNAPTNVSANSTSSSSITVTWSPVFGAIGYRVYRSTSSSDNYTQVGSGTSSTSYTDNNNLSSGTTYYYKVSAYNNRSVESALSSYVSVMTILSTPPNVSASSTSSSSITVSWPSVNGATGYHVYRSASASGNYTQVGDVTDTTSYTDTGLDPGMTYYYTVSAYNGAGVESLQSSNTYATTGFNSPSNVSATALSSSSISVSWSPVSGAEGYYVYRSTSYSGSYYKVATAYSTTCKDDNVSPGATYYYKVSAYSGAVESSQSSPPASATTTLNAPANVSANSTSPRSITVNWSVVSGATGYRVYRSTSADGVYNEVGTSASSPYTDNNNLTVGTTYYYRVSAYNSTVSSSQSPPTAPVTIMADDMFLAIPVVGPDDD
ncbi:MAG: fibronectin type III domain-containing protein [Chitinispirillales bacterium]|nr:fibronectin type III domain-containing protein [Chitinispirillales bacterium]